jgi:hypothetical protein
MSVLLAAAKGIPLQERRKRKHAAEGKTPHARGRRPGKRETDRSAQKPGAFSS